MSQTDVPALWYTSVAAEVLQMWPCWNEVLFKMKHFLLCTYAQQTVTGDSQVLPLLTVLCSSSSPIKNKRSRTPEILYLLTLVDLKHIVQGYLNSGFQPQTAMQAILTWAQFHEKLSKDLIILGLILIGNKSQFKLVLAFTQVISHHSLELKALPLSIAGALLFWSQQ